MAIMTSYVYPAANPVLDEQLHSFGGAWVIARALFGAALGFVPWYRRRLARRLSPAERGTPRDAAPSRR
jgi:hypothetical protein